MRSVTSVSIIWYAKCQHDIMLCLSMLSIIWCVSNAKCHYAECHYVECHNFECFYAECQYGMENHTESLYAEHHIVCV